MKKKLGLFTAMLAVLMGSFLPVAGSGQALFQAPVAGATAPSFSKPAFQKVWQTTDQLVDTGQARRSFLWGPSFIDAGYERYDDAAPLGSQRRWVQYFDKSRMELNNPYGDPSAPFYVTNGLLVVELVSGRRQEGNNRKVDTGNPANNVIVAGDALSVNPDAPTYKTLRAVASYDDASVAANRKPNRSGQKATETLTKAADGSGIVGNNPSFGNLPGVVYTFYSPELGHNIPKVFWDYMNQIGPKFDPASQQIVNGQKVFDWIFAMGLPITDAYWTRVKVAGVDRDVLMQCFERRCLTYTPANDPAFQVEMGNVGQHYLVWRYGGTKMPSSEPINDPVLSPWKLPALSYGINAHYYYQDRNQVTGWVKDLGARWVRQQITWSDIEDATRTDPDRFNWSEIDKTVDNLYLNNIHIILSPIGTPAQYKTGTAGLPDASKINKFSEFMYALANRYKGKVDAYEIWNEANLSRESGSPIDVRRFFSMMQKGYNAVKSADPGAWVIFGALSPTETNDPNYALPDTTFLQQMYAINNGEIRNYFDAMGMHPGGQINPPDTLWPSQPGPGPDWQKSPEFYFRRIEQLRQIMEQNGDGNKQAWLTEFGWSSDTNPQEGYEYAKLNTEAQQAQYIQRAYQKAQSDYPWMGVMALWNLNFSLPTVTNTRPNGKNDEKLGFAILRRDGSKRPAYFAYQAQARTAK